MKSYTKLISGLLIIMIATSCFNGAGLEADPKDAYQFKKDECQAVVNRLISSGDAVAAIGVAESSRRDIAERKATIKGRTELANSFEVKVDNLAKLFTEEIGSGGDVEINELFSDAIKTVTSKNLKSSTIETTKYVKETDSEGKVFYHCFVVMSIKANSIYASFSDELKNKDTKTYERFRASQAFDELEAELK